MTAAALASRNGLLYRPDTADENVFHEVFDRRVYALNDIAGLKPPADRPLIIDAGAHIGVASVWLAREWPDACIIAVEPDRANRELLMQNAMGLPIYTILSAVTSREGGRYRVIDPDKGTWGYRTEPSSEPGAARAFTMAELFRQLPYHHPWIVKIDIEGGEADLFAANTQWMDQVPVIMIELHDWMIPGSGDTWRAAVEAHANRREFQSAEITVSVREDWLA